MSISVIWCIAVVVYELSKDAINVINSLAALATILSLVLVLMTLQSTKRINETQLLFQYDELYFKKEMQQYLRILREFHSKYENTFEPHRDERNQISGDDFMTDGLSWCECIDTARRQIKSYFINALDLYLEGMISTRVFLRIIDKNAITIFFDIVEPMEWNLNRDYDHTKFEKIMTLAYPIYTKYKKSDRNFRKAMRRKQSNAHKNDSQTCATTFPVFRCANRSCSELPSNFPNCVVTQSDNS